MRKINDTKNIKFERIWAMPNKNTFEILPIKKLILEEVDLSKYWIDPFANRNKVATVTNTMKGIIEKFYKLDPSRVMVTHNAANLAVFYKHNKKDK